MNTLTEEKINDLIDSSPRWSEIIDISEVICITGMKRHGKSALAYWLSEQLASGYKKPIYAWGIPTQRVLLFPPYINMFHDVLRTQNFYNSIIVYDEIHRSFSARKSTSKQNAELSDMLTFSGQNNQILLLVTLNNALIDVNTFRICNPVLIYKRVGYLQASTERMEIRKFSLEASNEWDKIPRGRKDTPERNLENKLSYVISDTYKGWMVNNIPEWWSKEISEMHSRNTDYNEWIRRNLNQFDPHPVNNIAIQEMNIKDSFKEFIREKHDRKN